MLRARLYRCYLLNRYCKEYKKKSKIQFRGRWGVLGKSVLKSSLGCLAITISKAVRTDLIYFILFDREASCCINLRSAKK